MFHSSLARKVFLRGHYKNSKLFKIASDTRNESKQVNIELKLYQNQVRIGQLIPEQELVQSFLLDGDTKQQGQKRA